MQQHPEHTRTRIRQLVERLKTRIYTRAVEVEQLEISPAVKRISYAEAQELDYTPVRPGRQLGPLWATYWFQGSVEVPEDWRQGQVDFIWKSHSEATLWLQGNTVGGINPGRDEVPLTADMIASGRLEFQVEVACNGLFGAVGSAYDTVEPFVLDRCAIALFDADAWNLYYDLLVLAELEREDDLEADWRGHLLSSLNRIANALDELDPATWPAARQLTTQLLNNRNGSFAHELSTVGHAHIDTAWLWPIQETWRKCIRTFSTATLYMDRYPEYKFACSQAAQYAAIKERNPDLYRRIQDKFASGQWIPVGGTWVEPDCNIPSGESLCRQFLFGQRFFSQEFGIRCTEFWNPDVFGYNGQLPQIMQQAGVRHFLTQKLSWNAFNKPMHQTFHWEGIDGTRILTHFPPANSYNSVATVEELRRLVREYKDNDRSSQSYLLFGIGDGGGGPTRDMLERLRRARDLQGLPRSEIRAPRDFFARLEADCADVPRVVGELYFELHRGTYTTQAATKRGNRKGEILLHDVEFLATLAQRIAGATYPKEQLDELWKRLLTNQFHDILPGSSITLVYADSQRDYDAIQQQGTMLKETALHALGTQEQLQPLNTTSFDRTEVSVAATGRLVCARTPSYGIGTTVEAQDQVSVSRDGQRVVLENRHLRAVLDADGTLTSLVDKEAAREALAGTANQMLIYEDHPTAWDAWEVDLFMLETATPCAAADTCEIVSRDPLRVEVEFNRKIGRASTMCQRIRLDAHSRRLEFHTQVEWHEENMMLKVAFPVEVRALNATYEMPFGYVERPTHYNSSQDLARFEVPGHRWVDLSEHGFGVSLFTDCKYGYHTLANTMHITLLRAPKSPDPQADMGHHEFAYAIFPHAGSWQEAGVVGAACCFNTPLCWAPAPEAPKSFFSLNDANLVLDTVKRAEDGDEVILRLYECHGARGLAALQVGIPFTRATRCNTLEEDGEDLEVTRGTIEIPYRPHELISIKLR